MPPITAAQIQLNLGRRLLIANDLAGAVAHFDEALRLDPGNSVVLNDRGTARFRQDDLRGALADLDIAIELDPGNYRFYSNRGNMRHRAGDLDGAIADFDRLLAMKPDFAIGYIFRGNVRYHKGDLPSFRTDYETAFRINPQVSAAVVIQRLALGPERDPIAPCNEHLASNPNDSVAMGRRCLVHFLQGKDTEAQADLDRYLTLDPGGKYRMEWMIRAAKDYRSTHGLLAPANAGTRLHPRGPGAAAEC
jgi:tetratricopeptide (TPR) repeat protein